MESRTTERLGALEAVRGLAALAVVLHHAAGVFWPELYFPVPSAPVERLLDGHTYLRLLCDGPFAVRIFFVLSGVVLSLAYFRRCGQDVLAEAAVRRYFRLTPPILASLLAAYLLLVCGAMCPGAYADQAGRAAVDPLRNICAFPPHLGPVVRDGLGRVFVQPVIALSYNPVLWTMPVELGGSLVLFAFLALAGHLRRRWLLYAALGAGLAVWCPLVTDFLIGAALCDLYIHAQKDGKPLTVGPLAGAVLLLLGIALGTAHPGWLWTQRHPGGPHGSFTKAAGAALILAAALFCPWVRRRLEGPALLWLGRVSFALYLVHWPILFSLGCATYACLRGTAGWSHAGATTTAVAASLAGSLLAAWALYHLVDRPAVHLSRSVARWIVSPAARLPARRSAAVPAACSPSL
jgi:peptidoglycan/LPS O-acetylase OafA/YrhL